MQIVQSTTVHNRRSYGLACQFITVSRRHRIMKSMGMEMCLLTTSMAMTKSE